MDKLTEELRDWLNFWRDDLRAAAQLKQLSEHAARENLGTMHALWRGFWAVDQKRIEAEKAVIDLGGMLFLTGGAA